MTTASKVELEQVASTDPGGRPRLVAIPAGGDEYFLIESQNPKVSGLDAAVRSYVDFLYAIA